MHAPRNGVKLDLRLAPLQLPHHVCNLVLERQLALALISAFAKHKSLDNAAQCFR